MKAHKLELFLSLFLIGLLLVLFATITAGCGPSQRPNGGDLADATVAGHGVWYPPGGLLFPHQKEELLDTVRKYAVWARDETGQGAPTVGIVFHNNDTELVDAFSVEQFNYLQVRTRGLDPSAIGLSYRDHLDRIHVTIGRNPGKRTSDGMLGHALLHLLIPHEDNTHRLPDWVAYDLSAQTLAFQLAAQR